MLVFSSYIEGVSAAQAIADKHNEEIDVRQQLLGLGAANLAMAFGQGYPVAGGLSQSAVNDKAGAKTPLSLVFASTTLALCLLFLTGLLRNLPSVVLADCPVAVSGLIQMDAFRHLWRVSRFEFRISMVALLGCVDFRNIIRSTAWCHRVHFICSGRSFTAACCLSWTDTWDKTLFRS